MRVLTVFNDLLVEKFRASLIEKDSLQVQLKVEKNKATVFLKLIDELERINEGHSHTLTKTIQKLRKSFTEKKE